jgi:hypothetical protein
MCVCVARRGGGGGTSSLLARRARSCSASTKVSLAQKYARACVQVLQSIPLHGAIRLSQWTRLFVGKRVSLPRQSARTGCCVFASTVHTSIECAAASYVPRRCAPPTQPPIHAPTPAARRERAWCAQFRGPRGTRRGGRTMRESELADDTRRACSAAPSCAVAAREAPHPLIDCAAPATWCTSRYSTGTHGVLTGYSPHPPRGARAAPRAPMRICALRESTRARPRRAARARVPARRRRWSRRQA